MEQSDEVINIVQEVLRGLLVGLIAGVDADPARMASAIQAFAAAPQVDHTSRLMLINLAEGLGEQPAAKDAPA